MIKKLLLNQAERVKIGFWSFDPSKISKLFFYLLVLFLPTQLGKHFWLNWSFVYGLRLDYLSPTFYLTDVFILAIFIFSLPKLLPELKKISRQYLFGFLIFLIILLFGLMGAKNFWAGIYGLIKLLEFSFLAFFISVNLKGLNKGILSLCVFLSIMFESLLAFLQYFNQGTLGGIFYLFGERTFSAVTPGIANASINGQLILRPYATFSHPNVLAAFLIFSMLLLLLFSLKNKKFKTFVWFGSILGTMALLVTLSRSAILLWLIYLIILFGTWSVKKYKKHKFNPRQIVLSALIIIGVVGIILLQNNFVLQRFLTTSLSDESVIQRQELMTQSLNMLLRNPILGVGINNFFDNLSVVPSNGNVFLIQPVHNIFLLVLAETGIIGFCAFLFLLIKSFIVIVKKQNKYLMLCLLAIMFLGMFDHYFLTLQQGQLLLSFVIGITLSKT